KHVLAALWAIGLDNAIVEMDANEPPIGDGSAQVYVDLIRKAGVTAQEEPRDFSTCAKRCMLDQRPALCSFCCRMRSSAFRAHKPDQTISSRSFYRWKLHPQFSNARSPRPARL